MRPLLLEIRGFGPFADVVKLDFRGLGDSRLFLIHGPTGAGKTSILDAICFALYGESSGDERKAHGLRSDYAADEDVTEVTLTFALGAEVYKITRSPEYERARKRGGGKAKERQKATLWRLSGDEGTDAVVASAWKESTERIAQLLGFQSAQFRQVVVLPQGQFRRLLQADSRERQEILETLFQTHFYLAVEQRLQELAKELRGQYERLKDQRQAVLDQAGQASEEALQAHWEEMTGQLLGQDKQIAALVEAAERAQNGLAEGRRIAALLKERAEADGALADLEAQRGIIAADKARLERGQRATGLRDLATETKRAMEACKKEEGAWGDAGEAFKKVTALAKACAEKLATEEARGAERAAIADKRSALGRLKVDVQALDEAQKKLGKAKGLSEQSRAKEKAAIAALEKAKATLDQANEELVRLQVVAAKLDANKAMVEESERRQKAWGQLLEKRNAAGKTRELLAQVQEELDAAREQLDKSRTQLHMMEEAWAAGQAAVLAEQLTPGQPCPVCGAKEHPAPARADAHMPTEAALKKLRKQVETEDGFVREGETKAAGLQVKLTEQEKVIVEEAEAFGGSFDTVLGDFGLSAARMRFEESKTATEKVAEIEQSLPGLKEAIVDAEKVAISAGENRAEAECEQARQEGDVSRLAQGIPEGLDTLASVDAALREVETVEDVLERRLREAREHASQADRDAAKGEEALKQAAAKCEEAKTYYAEREKAFAGRLRDAGFEGVEDYQQACLEDGEMAQLGRLLEAYSTKLGAARDRADRARAAITDETVPDIEGLEAESKTAQDNVATAHRKRGELSREVKLLDECRENLSKKSDEMASVEARHGVVGRVADVASGRNAVGVGLERFVLSFLLDDVLRAASQRLQLMSRNRFALQRTDDRAHQRAAAGLDLVVEDAYTGTMRPVNSLSGGEGFLASLALALGLADTVQGYAGGTRLDTLFVDEGFGSLDPESLDLAFDTLRMLQGAGRLVGVISHVPELRERIDARLEVIPGQRGSSARFVV